ncbi:DUF2867 domain-containing protein [Pseudomonas sp.]|uniref:DUF2867 domain-containing protein n=1 Tax=Pseudomonas sp. TaxID=306 RepID=UPI003CC68319
MTTTAHACPPPPASAIMRYVPGADFIDCHYVLVRDTERTALRHLLTLLAATPPWLDNLMKLRNSLVQVAGLKDLGSLARIDLARPDEDYRPGDRTGIFTLQSNAADEVLVADQDKHLDVFLALTRLPVAADGTRTVVLSTVVRTHNWLGKVYMLPVAPFHRRIAPMTLRGINRR